MSSPATSSTKLPSVDAAIAGAEKILVRCLELSEGESLCLFFDETTDDVADIILQAAIALGISVNALKVPIEEQRRYAASNKIPQTYESALQSSRGVLTCLAGDTQATAFRRELLRQGVNEGTRFGHMPGANLYSLATAADIDYAEAVQRCEELAYAMDIGNVAKLKTWIFDPSGKILKEHVLTMQLGGPLRNPITSTGVIPSHTWGNIPGGETFIAPIEDTAEGTFILNGSMNGRVCHQSEYVVLEFEAGRARVALPSKRDLGDYLWGMIKPALDSGDRFANCLAELGVGVNPGIKELTGSTLIDEKCAGTAHIALGDNERYGGLHASNIHEDLITLSPTLSIDGKVILQQGEYRFNPAEWFTNLEHVALRPEFLNPTTCVRRKSGGVSADTSDGLRIVRLVSAGRRGRYRISTEADSQLLRSIWELLPFSPGSIALGEVRQKLNRTSDLIVFRGLQSLFDHGMIRIEEL